MLAKLTLRRVGYFRRLYDIRQELQQTSQFTRLENGEKSHYLLVGKVLLVGKLFSGASSWDASGDLSMTIEDFVALCLSPS